MTTQPRPSPDDVHLPATAPGVDGLAVASAGHGDPVLFLNGLGMAGCSWGPQVRPLRNEFRCIWFDNRGTGNSPGPLGPISVESLVADAIRVLDLTGVDRAHIVGHSMGGVVAQQLAVVRPDRVRSMALLCTFARGVDAALPRRGVTHLGLRALVGTLRSRATAAARLLASPAEIAVHGMAAVVDVISEEFGRPLAQRPAVAIRQLRALVAQRHAPAPHSFPRVPILVVSGADDRLAPALAGRHLAATLGARRYLEIPGASHALPILQASVVNAALVAHLRSA